MAEGYDYSELERGRLEKLQQLRAKGVEPFPPRVERTHTSAQAIAAFERLEKKKSKRSVSATLVGRVRSTRIMGKIIFAHIEDGHGSLQLFLRANDIGEEKMTLFRDYFDIGDFVQASGEMFRTKSGEVSLRAAR